MAPGSGIANGNITINPLGDNNTVTLVGGNLFLREDVDNTSTFATVTLNTNDIVVNGNATITVDRTGANTGESAKLVLVKSLTIGGETLTTAQGSSYRLGVAGKTTMTGSSTFSLGADMVFSGGITDNGAGLAVIKTGTATLWFNDTTSDFTGPLVINQGAVRFGNSSTASTSATIGQATRVIVNPGGSIQLQAAANVANAKIEVHSSGSFAGSVVLNSAFDPKSLITSDSSGLLLLGATFSTALDMSLIGDGTFQLGTTGAFTYSAGTLGVGAVNPLTGVNVYRLGGNAQNLTITAANANVLTGDNQVQIGSLLSAGGTVLFNNTNNYNGRHRRLPRDGGDHLVGWGEHRARQRAGGCVRHADGGDSQWQLPQRGWHG
ncbi:MAG: hypothetical protein WDN28_13205 [Chthoniobacter sp.]